jgi:hypothetical protein
LFGSRLEDIQHMSHRLDLKPEPDGFGYIYGTLVADDGEVYRVNVLPPASEWRGDMRPGADLPHASDWIVYLDGEEIARVSRREDIAPTVARRLPKPA